jgi:methionyl aminopeptidase
VCLNGYHGDLNETYFVGTGTSDPARAEKAKALMKCALECLELAMGRCKPGARFRDLGEAIQTHANGAGYGVVKDFCGHGIGALFHCAPNVPHYAKNKAVGTMKPGMTFTIEPMVNEGTHKTKHWPDGWTAVTADGGRSAQYEHTMVVTETGLDVLTKRTANSRPFY